MIEYSVEDFKNCLMDNMEHYKSLILRDLDFHKVHLFEEGSRLNCTLPNGFFYTDYKIMKNIFDMDFKDMKHVKRYLIKLRKRIMDECYILVEGAPSELINIVSLRDSIIRRVGVVDFLFERFFSECDQGDSKAKRIKKVLGI